MAFFNRLNWMLMWFCLLVSTANAATTIFTTTISTTATSIQDLLQQNKLQISARIAPAISSATTPSPDSISTAAFAPKQQVDLYIQVKTDRWFAAGTYISPFSVPDSLVLQRNKLANNYALREKGVTWSVQEWQLTLYPQQSGEYIIPAIPVSVSIATASGEKVSGNLLTMPLTFQVALPDARLTPEVDWVVAPELTFNQRWNVDPDAELMVGDAITRTLTLSGRETSIMLLPDFAPLKAENIQSYSDRTLAKDSQNRGDFFAEKTMQHTYIIQENGQLVLPELKLLWWNTQTQTLQTLVVAGGEWSVQHTLASFIRAYQAWLISALIGCLSLAYMTLRLWRRYQHAQLPHWLMFVINVYRQHWPQCNRDLYNQHYARSGQPQLRQSGSIGSLVGDPVSEITAEQVKGEGRRARIIARWSARQYSQTARWLSHSCKQQGLLLTLWLVIRGK